jgi:SAM-dependent methyltransferase
MPAMINAAALRVQTSLRRVIGFALCLLLAAPTAAQERFSLFVATEQEDVPRMLKLARLKDGDVVYDLGSGDGRIVLEAAKMYPAARGRGIEIDEKLVMEARKVASAAGLSNRVQFLHQNAFDADLKDANIIAMWLWPELMRMLRPKILAEARPGTRIVTRIWDLGPAWKPDAVDTDGAQLFMWIVPAKVEGYWSWTLDFGKAKRPYAAVLEQHFQAVEGVVRSGNRRGVMDSMKLAGDEISFSLMITLDGVGLARHQFNGRVKGDVIEGTVRILHEPYDTAFELPWRATRTATSAYFAPTGVNVK